MVLSSKRFWMMTGMDESKDFLYRTLGDKDQEDVKRLVESTFEDFLNGKYWDWKYKLNPNFDQSLVAVAEKDGRIIGCNHWLPRTLKISGSIEAKAILGADIAVRPEYRGHGIGKKLLLFMRSSQVITKNLAVISYMFSDPNLSKSLYEPVAGYVSAPSTTVSYVKLLNWNELKKRVNALSQEIQANKEKLEKMAKLDLTVLLELPSAPRLLLRLNNNMIEVDETHLKNPKVILRSDLYTLTILKKRKGRIRNLLKALLTGKLKIRGSLMDLFRFYQNLWLIEEIFSKKIF